MTRRNAARQKSKKPFVSVTEDDMCKLIDDFDARNTKKQVRYAVNRTNKFGEFDGFRARYFRCMILRYFILFWRKIECSNQFGYGLVE